MNKFRRLAVLGAWSGMFAPRPKSTPRNFASWARKANRCARSSPLKRKNGGFGVASPVPKWRTRHDSNV